MNHDKLDQTSNLTLNRFFALEVAGFTQAVQPANHLYRQPNGGRCDFVPAFCSEPTSVFEVLDRVATSARLHRLSDNRGYEAFVSLDPCREFVGRAPECARAIVIALIRAKRANAARSFISPPVTPQLVAS